MTKQQTSAWFAEKIADADARGSNWLAEANAAAESGDQDKAQKCYDKGQFWLDRSNSLRDRSLVSKALCPDLPKGRRCPLCGGAYVCLQSWRAKATGSAV